MNSPSIEQVTRRAAVSEDIPLLVELRRLTMSAHQSNSGMTPSDEERERRVMARFDCAEILLFDGEPIGMFKVAKDGLTWEFIQLQIVPKFQGAGLGEALIREMLAQAQAVGASVRLNVLKANPARRLYERL